MNISKISELWYKLQRKFYIIKFSFLSVSELNGKYIINWATEKTNFSNSLRIIIWFFKKVKY